MAWVLTGDSDKFGVKTGHQVREPVIIQGSGTLRAKKISFAEVHLMPGVELLTSGEYHDFGRPVIKTSIGKNGCPRETIEVELYDARPNRNVNTTNENDLVYAAYIVEPGAKLVFTDNPDYPESLIERR